MFSSATSETGRVLLLHTDTFLQKVRDEIKHLDEVCECLPDKEEWDLQVHKFELALN